MGDKALGIEWVRMNPEEADERLCALTTRVKELEGQLNRIRTEDGDVAVVNNIQLRDEITRLKAENERLKRMRERDNTDYYDEIKRLRAQLVEAGVALEQIAEDKCSDSTFLIVRINAMEDCAHEALAKLRSFTADESKDLKDGEKCL